MENSGQVQAVASYSYEAIASSGWAWRVQGCTAWLCILLPRLLHWATLGELLNFSMPQIPICKTDMKLAGLNVSTHVKFLIECLWLKLCAITNYAAFISLPSSEMIESCCGHFTYCFSLFLCENVGSFQVQATSCVFYMSPSGYQRGLSTASIPNSWGRGLYLSHLLWGQGLGPHHFHTWGSWSKLRAQQKRIIMGNAERKQTDLSWPLDLGREVKKTKAYRVPVKNLHILPTIP